MKKISLITIFDNPNFGTYLQALALGLILEKQNTKVEIIHYERPYWNSYSNFRRKTKFLEPLWQLYYRIRGIEGIIQRIGCRNFVKKYLKVTKPYYSYEELCTCPPKADIYITGSDQVWNTIHNNGVDKSFYLGFAPEDKPRFSYGASIGMSSIPKEYVESTIELLRKYRKISVREESNVFLLKSIGIESEVVLDPTLLLRASDWERYARNMFLNERYVLVYSVESIEKDKEVGVIARKIANYMGYKVYEVNYSGPEKAIPMCDKHFYYATPDLFLALIKNASFIVGSSFHITAFAINFNKPFISIAPDRFSSRIDGLLQMTNLLDRKVCCVEDVSLLDFTSEIDYNRVNEILEEHRVMSMNYIKNII